MGWLRMKKTKGSSFSVLSGTEAMAF